MSAPYPSGNLLALPCMLLCVENRENKHVHSIRMKCEIRVTSQHAGEEEDAGRLLSALSLSDSRTLLYAILLSDLSRYPQTSLVPRSSMPLGRNSSNLQPRIRGI